MRNTQTDTRRIDSLPHRGEHPAEIEHAKNQGKLRRILDEIDARLTGNTPVETGDLTLDELIGSTPDVAKLRAIRADVQRKFDQMSQGHTTSSEIDREANNVVRDDHREIASRLLNILEALHNSLQEVADFERELSGKGYSIERSVLANLYSPHAGGTPNPHECPHLTAPFGNLVWHIQRLTRYVSGK